LGKQKENVMYEGTGDEKKIDGEEEGLTGEARTEKTHGKRRGSPTGNGKKNSKGGVGEIPPLRT